MRLKNYPIYFFRLKSLLTLTRMDLMIRVGWKKNVKVINGESIIMCEKANKQDAKWRGCKIKRLLLNA